MLPILARPGSNAAAQRYASLLKNAAAIISLSGLDHDAYTRNRIDMLIHVAGQSMPAAAAKQTSGASD